jgi:hypothetical protein
VLVATILGSSLAFIDSTVVNVALPALQSACDATLADIQCVVESYALTLAALLLSGAVRWGIASADAKSLLAVCSSLRRHRDGAVSPAPLVSSLPLAPCRVWALRCSFLAVCRLSARRFQRANVVEQSERGPGPPLSQYRGRTVSSLNDACQCLSMPVLSHQRLNDEQSNQAARQ